MNTDIQDFNALDNWSWAKQHNEDYLCAELRFLRIAAKQLQEAQERLSCWLDALQNGVGTVKDVTRDHYKTNVVWAAEGNAGIAEKKRQEFRRVIEAEYRRRIGEPSRDLSRLRAEIREVIAALTGQARGMEDNLETADADELRAALSEMRDSFSELSYKTGQLIELGRDN